MTTTTTTTTTTKATRLVRLRPAVFATMTLVAPPLSPAPAPVPPKPKAERTDGEAWVVLGRIIDAAVAVAGVTREDLAGPSRQPRIVLARRVIVCVARSHSRASYPMIARAMTGRTHSSLVQSHQRAGAMLANRWPGHAELSRAIAAVVKQSTREVTA